MCIRDSGKYAVPFQKVFTRYEAPAKALRFLRRRASLLAPSLPSQPMTTYHPLSFAATVHPDMKEGPPKLVANGAISFNQPFNSWNVSKVKDMEFMFDDAKSFNQPLNKWNVSNVTNMKGMFLRATSFNQPLNKWNVSNVVDMGYMFRDATSFNQPLNNWNVSNVRYTYSSYIFWNADSFNQPLHAPWYR